MAVSASFLETLNHKEEVAGRCRRCSPLACTCPNREHDREGSSSPQLVRPLIRHQAPLPLQVGVQKRVMVPVEPGCNFCGARPRGCIFSSRTGTGESVRPSGPPLGVDFTPLNVTVLLKLAVSRICSVLALSTTSNPGVHCADSESARERFVLAAIPSGLSCWRTFVPVSSLTR